MPLICGTYISVSLLKVPDLSLESAYTCGALFASALLPMLPLPLPLQLIVLICVSLASGALVGLLSSSCTMFLRIPHLLSSIITIGIYHGLYQLLVGSYVATTSYANPLACLQLSPYYPEMGCLLFMQGILLVVLYMIFKTQLGYCFVTYGNNASFFDHFSISKRYVFIMGICIANSLAGLSGYLFAQSTGFAEMNMGIGKVLLCITALILSKTIIPIKKPISLMVPIYAGLLFFALQQLLLLIGFNLRYFTMIQALVVLVIMAFRQRNAQPSDSLGV